MPSSRLVGVSRKEGHPHPGQAGPPPELPPPSDSQTRRGSSCSRPPSLPFWVLLPSDVGLGSLHFFSQSGRAAWDLQIQRSEFLLTTSTFLRGGLFLCLKCLSEAYQISGPQCASSWCLNTPSLPLLPGLRKPHAGTAPRGRSLWKQDPRQCRVLGQAHGQKGWHPLLWRLGPWPFSYL